MAPLDVVGQEDDGTASGQGAKKLLPEGETLFASVESGHLSGALWLLKKGGQGEGGVMGGAVVAKQKAKGLDKLGQWALVGAKMGGEEAT